MIYGWVCVIERELGTITVVEVQSECSAALHALMVAGFY